MIVKWRVRIHFFVFLVFAIFIFYADAPRYKLYLDAVGINFGREVSNEVDATQIVGNDSISVLEPVVTPTIEPIIPPTITPSSEPTVEPTPVPAWNRNYFGEGLPEFEARNGDLLHIIKECKEYYAYNGFNYCMCPGKRRIPGENSFKTSCSKHKVRGSYVTDCSTYVSWVLHEYGLMTGRFDLAEFFSSQKNSGAFHKIAKENGGVFFEVVWNVSECIPGDILIYSGHVEFFEKLDFDGRPIVWSCGSGKYVNHPYPERASRTPDKIARILRLKMY